MTVVAEIQAVLSTDLRQLEKGFKDAEKKAQASASAIERNFGKIDSNKAVGNILGEVKGKALAGGEALGAFGAALEPLGPLGVAAAAGIGAIAFAADQARKAMDWADELDRQASMLGVTTTQLQKFDYAAEAMSVGMKEGREALSAFSGIMGAFESATGDKKVAKFADAIKLTREEIRAATDPVEKLQIVMEKLAELPNSGERRKFAQAFGLDAMLPVLQDGTAGVSDFIAKMREAQSVGGVISEESIRKAAEMNDEVDRLSFLIDAHFKQAFIDLAPAIESVAGFMEGLIHLLTDFIGQIPLAVRGIGDLVAKIDEFANRHHALDSFGWANKSGEAFGKATGTAKIGPMISGAIGSAWDSMISRGRVANLKAGIKDLMAGGKVQAPADFDQLQNQGRGAALSGGGGSGAAEAAKAIELQRRQANERLQAEKETLGFKIAELQAQRDITDGAAGRAKIEEEIAGLTDKQKEIDLRRLASDAHYDLLAKKITPAMEKQVIAQTEAARLSGQKVADLQKQARDQKTALAVADETHRENEAALNLARELAGYESDTLTSRAAMATTASDRADLEIQALRDQQNVEREIYKERLRYLVELKKLDPNNPNGITEGQAAELQAGFDKSQASRLDEARFSRAGPLEQYKRSILDIDTALQSVQANGLASFNEGLTNAILQTESLGEAFKNVANSIIADLVRIAVQRYITAPLADALFPSKERKKGGVDLGLISSFASVLPHFANGTDSAPGGWAVVGENGRELVSLGRGSQVISNRELQNMGIGGASAASRAPVYHLTTNVYADDAVMGDTIKGWIMQSVPMAVSMARKQTMEDLNRSNKQNLIRR